MCEIVRTLIAYKRFKSVRPKPIEMDELYPDILD